MMWFWISLGFAVVGGVAHPWVGRLQGTGLWVGKALASPESAPHMPNGFQEALAHGWPAWLGAVLGLLPIIAALCGFLHAWWLLPVSLLVTISVAYWTGRVSIIPTSLDTYLALYYGHLSRREANYRRDGDLLRAEAVAFLRANVEHLMLQYQGTGTPAPSMQVAREAPFGDRGFLLSQHLKASPSAERS
jgi:hypothetical protein